MGSFSIWYWLVVLIALSTVLPMARALKRVGLSRWWAVLSLIPVVNWFAIWAFAYVRWPKVDPPR